jgi:pimeloyl-ACP methyl ester carboxylesterase
MMVSEKTAELSGPVHYLDFGGPAGPPIVLVHGLGGSAVNWLAVAPALARRTRVLAVDLIGFGRTPPAGRWAGVPSNVTLLQRFIGEVAGAPAIVMGNSMGGAISLVLAAQHPGSVSGLVLVNAALPRPSSAPVDPKVAAMFMTYMIPGLGEAFVSLRSAMQTPTAFVRQMLRLCGVDPATLDPAILQAHDDIAAERRGMPWAHRAFLQAARSVMTTLVPPGRFWHRLQEVRAKGLIIHGTADRLVPVLASREAARRRPDFALSILDGVGHTPMLEVPDRFVEVVLAWMEQAGLLPKTPRG